ncbi:MAG TPA: HAD-IIA family hydrolase, partial [Tepidisphaeraceae bacterium]|nr:HAD-IIA family hydrolase [Tepidisphaeraceae bacterium]
FTRPFLDRLALLGIGHTFFTNNSSRSTKQYVEHLAHMGIPATSDEIYSSTHSTLDYLRQHHPNARKVFILGTPALQIEFQEHGYKLHGEVSIDEPEIVIVGFDTSLTYPRVCSAAYWISKGKPFIATHPDRICPTDKPTVLPDCGAICKMLEHATGRAPDIVLGKPHPSMLGGVMARHDLRPDQLAVVGDRLYTDMAMAKSAGAIGILVLTGESTKADAAGAQHLVDLFVQDVGELSGLLSQEGELTRC